MKSRDVGLTSTSRVCAPCRRFLPPSLSNRSPVGTDHRAVWCFLKGEARVFKSQRPAMGGGKRGTEVGASCLQISGHNEKLHCFLFCLSVLRAVAFPAAAVFINHVFTALCEGYAIENRDYFRISKVKTIPTKKT